MTASNVSTRCRAWVLTRGDGVKMGFTDHDRALSFVDPVQGALMLEPSTGFTASAFAETVGLTSSDMDIDGALTSDRITSLDLANGIYDRAEVRFYWLDWSNTAFYDLLSVSRIAEIVRNQNSFSATIEGLSAKASEPMGLRFARSCSLDFGGDISVKTGKGCGIDLSDPTYSQIGSIARAMSDRSFAVTSLTLAAGLCNFGKIKWLSGPNIGSSSTVKSHTIRGLESIFELDLAPAGTIEFGQAFTAEAGCDKSKTRCQEFSNMARRLAFDVPANNVATKYARDLASGAEGSSGVSIVSSGSEGD